MSMNWKNLYDDKNGTWRKGNLHTHTNKSGCGKMPIADVLKTFEDARFDFLAITDHNVYIDTKAATSSMTMLQGIEIDIKGYDHMGAISVDAPFYDASLSQQELIDRNIERGNLVVLHHPDWQLNEHYPMQKLQSLMRYDGIEIFNSVIEFLDGSALSTAKWDRLLMADRRVLGFCNQDFHDRPHLSDCANVVRTKSPDAKDILAALKNGNFYCHHGVIIEDIGRDGDTVFVRTKNAKLIRFIGNGGIVFRNVKASNADITINEKWKYVRIECLGEGDEISWSQPFYIS
ncbi:MAG: CehA/McbA family metallohydrolase [Spirochaetota bacterium]